MRVDMTSLAYLLLSLTIRARRSGVNISRKASRGHSGMVVEGPTCEMNCWTGGVEPRADHVVPSLGPCSSISFDSDTSITIPFQLYNWLMDLYSPVHNDTFPHAKIYGYWVTSLQEDELKQNVIF